ncbi:organic solvent ABC transporter permease [Marinobacter sp. SS5-14b]|uniref:organic solvent ABC transporter permease n=1 Tax=Marinobacter sp. SS5-14b TaxID=3050456 RepID=UPI0026DEFE00|nr:organic solvent ABC transporter permease [Marinobacter sp. SS5-14b]
MKFVHLSRLFLPLSAALLFSGCLDSGGSGSDDTSAGRIHSLGVGGLSYQTASQTGTTDEQGTFRYYPGETLTLKVGNLPIAEGVPAQEFVSFLEFQPELREALKTPKVDTEQLKDHALTEEELLSNIELLNRTRFLLALNWTEVIDDGEGIDIRTRVIEQLNAALSDPGLPGAVDFTVPQDEFTAEQSPANQLLASICFYEEENPLCDEPPTQAEIDAAPARPENDEDIIPEIFYKEDLESLRDRITQSVRSLEDADNERAREYLKRELAGISNAISRKYFLANHVAEHAASDTGLKAINIQKIGGDTELSGNGLEAISKRPQDVVVQTWSWQEAEVEYFVDGAAGGESEIIINFTPEDSYRWVRKSLRVRITD